MPLGEISDNDYRALAEFRHQIRRFLRSSEYAAREAGLEPQQHQLMVSVKGMPDNQRCTIGEVAERLQIQHHSTVELVDRLVRRGYVQRRQGGEDRREVLLQLTAKGEKVLRELSLFHREELRTAGPALVASLRKMMATVATPKPSGRKPPARAAAGSRNAANPRRNTK